MVPLSEGGIDFFIRGSFIIGSFIRGPSSEGPLL